MWVVMIYAQGERGDTARALDSLDTALRRRSAYLGLVKVAPTVSIHFAGIRVFRPSSGEQSFRAESLHAARKPTFVTDCNGLLPRNDMTTRQRVGKASIKVAA